MWIAAMAGAIILALVWGKWFFTTPMTLYETSRSIHITGQESVRARFTGNTLGGAAHVQRFRRRLLVADFPPHAVERIKPGQIAHVWLEEDRFGGHPVVVPATVVRPATEFTTRSRPGLRSRSLPVTGPAARGGCDKPNLKERVAIPTVWKWLLRSQRECNH